MKLLILADIDDLQWNAGTGRVDLVLALGDTADSLILEAAQAYQCDQIFAVKGNHDSAAPFSKPIIDLHLHTEEFNGLVFGGLNGSWKYKPRGHFLYEQDEVERMLASLPRVDVFVSHNSPIGIHDKTDEIHTGFEALNRYIKHHQPKLLVHGHQHTNIETVIGNTTVLGVYGHKTVAL